MRASKDATAQEVVEALTGSPQARALLTAVAAAYLTQVRRLIPVDSGVLKKSYSLQEAQWVPERGRYEAAVYTTSSRFHFVEYGSLTVKPSAPFRTGARRVPGLVFAPLSKGAKA